MSTHEYTPDTQTVRRAYTRYMRNAFIASTAEHEAEFDRWVARYEREVIERCAGIVELLYPLGLAVMGDAPAKIALAIGDSMPQYTTPKEKP